MGSRQLDRNDISAKEGSFSKQSSALVSLNRSNVVNNLVVKSQSEDENLLEASQVLTASEKYRPAKAKLLSSGSSIKEAIHEETFSSNSFDASHNEEEEVIPRVGDKYQVEVPALVSDSEQYLSTVHDQYLLGLTVPVVWAQLEESNPKDERSVCTNLDGAKKSAESKTKKKSQLGHNNRSSEPSTKLAYFQQEHREDSHLAKLGLKVGDKAQRRKMNESKIHFLVPDIQYKSWNDADVDNFLLGLHIFGKSFAQIKRFIENKDMGDIISFYYGKFCGSNMHRRWSDGIKGRNKKRVWGKKLFSGWRHQELKSRLLSNVTKENQNKLLEVSKLFTEEAISLEEYVFSLKTLVGLQNLAKAVGAGGKGKEDLTGVAMAPACPRIPVGKACSSMDTPELIKCLTGGFRLSKNQQNDIFWEAVWPRLLARGWQSEQPQNRRCSGSNSYLVFVKPGIKSFSREKLVKGEDYFDSVGDVLRIVASETQLLDLNAEEDGSSGLKEVTDPQPMSSEEEDIPDQRSPSSQEYQNVMTRWEFTIVDTSSMNEGKPYQLRMLSDALIDSETSMQCPIVDTSADIGDSSAMSDDKPSETTTKLHIKGRSRLEGYGVTSTDAVRDRQRSRERPLTTKALEALAMGGFYSVEKRKRSAGTKKHKSTLVEEMIPDKP